MRVYTPGLSFVWIIRTSTCNNPYICQYLYSLNYYSFVITLKSKIVFSFFKFVLSWAEWHVPIFIATWETEARGLVAQVQTEQYIYKRTCFGGKKFWRFRILCKCKDKIEILINNNSHSPPMLIVLRLLIHEYGISLHLLISFFSTLFYNC